MVLVARRPEHGTNRVDDRRFTRVVLTHQHIEAWPEAEAEAEMFVMALASEQTEVLSEKPGKVHAVPSLIHPKETLWHSAANSAKLNAVRVGRPRQDVARQSSQRVAGPEEAGTLGTAQEHGERRSSQQLQAAGSLGQRSEPLCGEIGTVENRSIHPGFRATDPTDRLPTASRPSLLPPKRQLGGPLQPLTDAAHLRHAIGPVGHGLCRGQEPRPPLDHHADDEPLHPHVH
jgi:hypothetical protein